MRDIIALAKAAKAYTNGAYGEAIIFDNKQHLEQFAILLEAEIRKEFEVEGERLRAYAAHERDLGAESFAIENNDLNQQITALTAQNAKLMEVLKHCHEVFVKYEINRIDGDEISDKAISIIMEALTPQPEKEGKE